MATGKAVETLNTPLMKAIRTAQAEGKIWTQAMHNVLRQYRSTPLQRSTHRVDLSLDENPKVSFQRCRYANTQTRKKEKLQSQINNPNNVMILNECTKEFLGVVEENKTPFS